MVDLFTSVWLLFEFLLSLFESNEFDNFGSCIKSSKMENDTNSDTESRKTF